jgi:hypothetical protein
MTSKFKGQIAYTRSWHGYFYEAVVKGDNGHEMIFCKFDLAEGTPAEFIGGERIEADGPPEGVNSHRLSNVRLETASS